MHMMAALNSSYWYMQLHRSDYIYNTNISSNKLELEASKIEPCLNNSSCLHSRPQYILFIGDIAWLRDAIQCFQIAEYKMWRVTGGTTSWYKQQLTAITTYFSINFHTETQVYSIRWLNSLEAEVPEWRRRTDRIDRLTRVHRETAITTGNNIEHTKQQPKKQRTTYYSAESLSWYSRDRLKHSRTPPSLHNLFITAASSPLIGTSSALFTVVTNSRASFCT